LDLKQISFAEREPQRQGGTERHGEMCHEGCAKDKDEERPSIIELLGLHFLRFHEEQVKQDMPEVIKAIEDYIVAFQKRMKERIV
jgi:very-short-patch-repair endonuclease